MNTLIQLVESIEVANVASLVNKPEYGGINVFVGTVRNHTKGKKVEKLFFECYAPMALLEMEKIAERAKEEFDIKEVAIHHVVGEKQPGEVVVVIAVAAFHRKAAFAACEFVIDTLKETVPIWKKEYFEDGSVWVAAHP
ncbi:molybdenum cofactor biosynthesis protein MoaE [Solitalea sp. MAHUQ-68]|uniref:Molybdopterin synthase catalytic subunit n=1 Tax=Solitalea agri TaxID=2953739 RepID=A0A9X2JEG6_9SPHI|nr:molybdenum cofactor biosynthesis protein MoaE [Solitalea agri]MCO4292376.1 molybdenum cofactor biosynthesis protein MoaE [Solitalea agri]